MAEARIQSSVVKTSDCEILSSIHGRQRRRQRYIGKRDLQAAVKHGIKQKGWSDPRTGKERWKYTFANVVFVTDSTSTREVTCYTLPKQIPMKAVTLDDECFHNDRKENLLQNPQLCTSHIILVIDQSASMNRCDVAEYVNRSEAVYGTLAIDFVQKQLNQGASFTDVVTLMEMRSYSTIVLEREPLSNVLYNKLLERQVENKPSDHGFFIPALQKVQDILELDSDNESCALQVIFLSDGKPSDRHAFPYLGEKQGDLLVKRDIGILIKIICESFRERLTFGTVGFGDPDTDFSILEYMAECATFAGATGVFQHSTFCTTGLSSAISNLGSSLTATRTRLTVLNEEKHERRVVRSFAREASYGRMFDLRGGMQDNDWRFLSLEDGVQRLVWNRNAHPERAKGFRGDWICVPFHCDEALGIAKRISIVGEGAERVVYYCREYKMNDQQEKIPLDPPLVAKESKFLLEKGEKKRRDFHRLFCTTQSKANVFAKQFNAEVQQIGYGGIANISFLECSVYGFENNWVLVEKMLNTAKYEKWNSNNGYVGGRNNEVDALYGNRDEEVGNENNVLEGVLDVIEEGSEEDCSESDSSDDDDEGDAHNIVKKDVLPTEKSPLRESVSIADFPQAFSHYTYRLTNRQMVVCDLQGTLDTTVQPALFELTDPVIHYQSRRNRNKFGKYGRTDHGPKGITAFFKTHSCNNLCRILGLPDDKDGDIIKRNVRKV